MRDTIDISKQVGFPIHHPEWRKAVEEFAALVRADEREETNRRANASWTLMCEKMVAIERESCAQLCEELPPVGESRQWERATLKDCAAAIRARGNT